MRAPQEAGLAQPGLGATYLGDNRTHFLVWAPFARGLDLRLPGAQDRTVPMQAAGGGYHEATVEGAGPGTRYLYRFQDGRERPDPASRYQPQGVHGPSAVTGPAFAWDDADWRGLELRDYVIYETHVGAFTPEGTFGAMIPHLDGLRELGVTALEIMPVAQFPGGRNWGYDGAGLFAAQDSYGGPDGLRRLVNEAHKRGLAVVLDVVYNHLGPEGNYLGEFGPYFTDRYRTFWGPALNFDDAESDEVRRFFLENALYWVRDMHIDALRLDAVHAIFDRSARPFLQELAQAVHTEGERLGRRIHLHPESDLNDPRLLRSPTQGGLGLDAQWADDFHHALHTLLTGEGGGYYADFGSVERLAKAYRNAYAVAGEYSSFRRRRHGAPPEGLTGERFIVFCQNHDQTGNRMLGERLASLVPYEALKLAAGAVILSPFLPLLFMGEEYGETAPFLYFISHTDPQLVEAVRKGRAEEFAAFAWQGEPPDPQSPDTFQRSKLQHALKEKPQNSTLLAFYKELLRLRRDVPALASRELEDIEALPFEDEKALLVRRGDALIVCNFADARAEVPLPVGGRWQKALDSAEERWLGPGSPAPAQLSGDEPEIALAPYSLVLFTASR